MTASDQRGAVFPRGTRLLQAVVAGALWSVAVRLMLAVPPAVAFAHRDPLTRENEGLAWAQVAFALVVTALLLLLAGWFSVRGHGRWRLAPRAVCVARAATWTACALLTVEAIAVASLGNDCFGSCASFPW